MVTAFRTTSGCYILYLPFYILKPKNTLHLLRRSISLSRITNKQYYSTHFCINTCSILTDTTNNSHYHLGLYFSSGTICTDDESLQKRDCNLQIDYLPQFTSSGKQFLLPFHHRVCLFNRELWAPQYNLPSDASTAAACSPKFNLPMCFKRQTRWILWNLLWC